MTPKRTSVSMSVFFVIAFIPAISWNWQEKKLIKTKAIFRCCVITVEFSRGLLGGARVFQVNKKVGDASYRLILIKGQMSQGGILTWAGRTRLVGLHCIQHKLGPGWCYSEARAPSYLYPKVGANHAYGFLGSVPAVQETIGSPWIFTSSHQQWLNGNWVKLIPFHSFFIAWFIFFSILAAQSTETPYAAMQRPHQRCPLHATEELLCIPEASSEQGTICSFAHS